MRNPFQQPAADQKRKVKGNQRPIYPLRLPIPHRLRLRWAIRICALTPPPGCHIPHPKSQFGLGICRQPGSHRPIKRVPTNRRVGMLRCSGSASPRNRRGLRVSTRRAPALPTGMAAIKEVSPDHSKCLCVSSHSPCMQGTPRSCWFYSRPIPAAGQGPTTQIPLIITNVCIYDDGLGRCIPYLRIR